MFYKVSDKSLLSVRNSILINAIPTLEEQGFKSHLLFHHVLVEIIWAILHTTSRAYQIQVWN